MEQAPRLAGIRLHPIKSLDPVWVTESIIGPAGGLEHDRAWALNTIDGRWVNAKHSAAMQRIRSAFAPDMGMVELSAPGDERRIRAEKFSFPLENSAAAEWFSEYFGQQIIVRYSPGGFPDDDVANGPTIISTATLQEVAGWFPGIDLEEARRRFRTTLEIDGVPAFWEDRLFGDSKERRVPFSIGEVNFEGSNPCARCPVPARDSQTGTDQIGFQQRFTELRREQLPGWAQKDLFDHFYRLATNTRVDFSEAGKTLRVGDRLAL